ncbi:MAG: 6-carboxytetrahydropterin synthase [Longimicrobiales bacterium]
MPEAFLTRRVRFAAAHRYYRADWDEARNRATFGACSNEHGHGHNYLLEVTVRGTVDAATGFAVDLAALDGLLEREVRQRLDHQHLNHAVAEFASGQRMPTSENVLLYLWPRLVDRMPPGTRLHRLRLSEDETFFVDYYGSGRDEPHATERS